MARAWSGNSGGLVMENAYHGITEVTVDLSPAEKNFTGATSPHIAEIKAPDDFRGNWKRDNPDRSVHYAQYCADAIAELEQHGHRPAAFFMDMILSTSGILTPPPGYTADVFQQVRAAGGLCIADEVQSGFGRLGTAMWGFERESVIPDIVTLGKPIAAGYPMGLVVTTRNIANKFNQSWEFFSTTGGNPVRLEIEFGLEHRRLGNRFERCLLFVDPWRVEFGQSIGRVAAFLLASQIADCSSSKHLGLSGLIS